MKTKLFSYFNNRYVILAFILSFFVLPLSFLFNVPAFAVTTPTTIQVSYPPNYRVFQRNDQNKGDINIKGTFTGPTAPLEARFNNGPWQQLNLTVQDASFSAILTDQPMGQGALQVRVKTNTKSIVTKSYIGIGDIFVIAGQSNGSGWGWNRQRYYDVGTTPPVRISNFGNDDNWRELADPVDTSFNQVDAVSADKSANASVWPVISRYESIDQKIPIAFIPTTLGGTSIQVWQKDDTTHVVNGLNLYTSMSRRIQAAGGKVKAILFWQGEADASSTSKDVYKTKLTKMTNDIYADFGVPTMVAQIGDRSDAKIADTRLDAIRMAQRESWGTGHILQGPSLYDVVLTDECKSPTVDCTIAGNHGDGVHFKSDHDIQVAAQRWWEAMRSNFYSNSESGAGPVVKSITFTPYTNIITLSYDVAQGELHSYNFTTMTADGTVEGFTVKENGVIVPVTNVTINNPWLPLWPPSVQLTLSHSVSRAVKVSYASGKAALGKTILTDGNKYYLPALAFVDQEATTIFDTPTPTATLTPTPTDIPTPTVTPEPTVTETPVPTPTVEETIVPTPTDIIPSDIPIQ